MKLYDKERIDWKNILFNNRTLFWLLLPIIIEQFLNSLMGMVDTMMVSTVGSDAIQNFRQKYLLFPILSM